MKVKVGDIVQVRLNVRSEEPIKAVGAYLSYPPTIKPVTDDFGLVYTDGSLFSGKEHELLINDDPSSSRIVISDLLKPLTQEAEVVSEPISVCTITFKAITEGLGGKIELTQVMARDVVNDSVVEYPTTIINGLSFDISTIFTVEFSLDVV